ncbi:MAG TPA: ABC transporter ATP-binding protein [Candidatus Anaerofilum faecale]|nr:ABC transporter ATP-binding protein [Candidatus Anaerofilum faecale]
METKILRAEALVKRYGKKEVLHGLDVAFEPGHIYGLIGRNGAGKTTLLGCLTGQLRTTGGMVSYGGAPVWENARALGEICFSRELSPMLMFGQNTYKVKEYLRAARYYYPHWDEEYARRLMEEFGLEEKKRICRLSKGMLSMVTIVLALASRAPVTILDEPVAGLDIVARERFYQLLLEDYAETGRTFIVSTHILDEASNVFEQVIVMDEGRIIENAPTDELVAQFHHVSGREDEVDAATAGCKILFTEQLGRSKAVCVRCGGETLARITAGRDLDVAPMNLQKVFVALTGHKEEDSHETK